MYTSYNGSRKKIPIKSTVLLGILILTIITIFTVQILGSKPNSTTVANHQQQEIYKPDISKSIGSPVRIIIPKINVDAVLEYVGITSEGEMEEPTIADNAAWFNRKPLPGEVGTSVIAGHFGFKDNKPAVFDKLHTLSKGDEIFVKDSKGVVVTFVVRDLKDYVPEQDATDVFSSADDKSHLNLITCKGTWNESQKSYETRLVVFADKVAI